LLFFTRKEQTIKIQKFGVDKDIAKPVITVGVAASLLQVMTLVQQLVLYNTASKYGGDNLMILIGAASKVQSFSFIPLWGMSQALQPAVGTNYGAQNYDRVKKINNVFMLGSFVLIMVLWVPIQLLPSQILGMFITDPAIVAEGINGFRVMFSILPALGVLILSMTFFQSLGKGTQASILVILRQLLLFVPLALILPRFVGAFGVWLAVPLTDGIVLVMSIAFIVGAYKKIGLEKRR